MYNAILTLTMKCISGIQGNKEICKNRMESSPAFVTVLSPINGYDQAAQIGKEADDQNVTIREILQQKRIWTPELDKAMDP